MKIKKIALMASIAGFSALIGIGNTTGIYLNNITEASSKIKAPDFTLRDLNGKKISLSSFKKKKNVYLNFWATWCHPCQGEMPDLEKLYKSTKNSDLVILTVNVGEDKNTVKSFINDNKYHFNVLLDSDNVVNTKYGVTSIPRSIFIDKNGNIVKSIIGSISKKEMDKWVNILKNNK